MSKSEDSAHIEPPRRHALVQLELPAGAVGVGNLIETGQVGIVAQIGRLHLPGDVA